jgi:hypothetical protein
MSAFTSKQKIDKRPPQKRACALRDVSQAGEARGALAGWPTDRPQVRVGLGLDIVFKDINLEYVVPGPPIVLHESDNLEIDKVSV